MTNISKSKISKVLFYFAVLSFITNAKTSDQTINSFENLVGELVSFHNTADNLVIPGYLSTPARLVEGQEYPAVILAHGCSGAFSYSNPYSGLMSLFKRWMKTLAARNYVVLLVDSFSPRGDGQYQCGNGEAGTSEVFERPNDINAGYDFLTKEIKEYISISKVALMGWSHGGSTVLTSLADIHPHNFQVGISYYPGWGLFNQFGGIWSSNLVPYADLYILHAGLDSLYTSGYCDERIKSAEELIRQSGSQVKIEMTVYPGTHHSFALAMRPNKRFNDKDVEARLAAKEKVLEILEKYLQ